MSATAGGGFFNFDAGKLTVHGKGKKDRTVPIPEAILPELKRQINLKTAFLTQRHEDH